jgi:putative peptidoglycan lipid II flippase
MTSGRRSGLARSAVNVGVGTALSRATGLLRVAVLAWAIGITALSDAYNLANVTPNIIYELLLGGVLSAALMPVFTEHLEHDDEDATSAVITVALIALAAITALAVLAAPIIVRLYQPPSTANFNDTVHLARLILPEIFFYGCMALGSAMLNARRRYFAPAWAPILNNLVVIAVCVLVGIIVRSKSATFLGVQDHMAILWLLGVGSTVGIVLMAGALLPAMRRAHVRLRFLPRWRHPGVRKLVRLSGWTMGYVVANQIALLVVYRLARGTGTGGLTTYIYAFTFFQLPHGLLAVSISTTFGPELARYTVRKNNRSFNRTTSLGLRMTTFLVLPASILYLVLGRPLVALLLERGLLRGQSVTLLADTLSWFSVGLVGFSLYLFVLDCFYSRTDARTPFLLNCFENTVNIALAIPLVYWYGVRGLALSFALAYIVSAVVAFVVLVRRVPGFNVPLLTSSLFRFALAGIVMAEITYLVSELVGANRGLGALARAVVGVLVGGGVYFAVLAYLRAPELRAVRTRLRPRALATLEPVDPDPARSAVV